MFSPKQEPKNNFDRYIGMAKCTIADINASDEEFKKLTGYIRNRPFIPFEYTHLENTNTDVPRISVEVIFKTDPTTCNGINTTFVKTFYLYKMLASSKTGKIQAIDRYGRTQWITPPELINTSIKQLMGTKKDGESYIRQIEPASMRQAYVGEERLMRLFSSALFYGSVNKFEKRNGKYVYVGECENADSYVCRIDNIEKLFMGDFSELNDALQTIIGSNVLLAIGVRQKDNGSYQSIHDIILQVGSKPREITRDIENNKLLGFGLDTEWDTVNTLHIYSPSIINNSNPTSSSNFIINPPDEDDDLPF